MRELMKVHEVSDLASAKELFILVSLYFLQGKDHKIPTIFDCHYDSILKVTSKKQENPKEQQNIELLAGCIELVFNYKSSIYYYNRRKIYYDDILYSEHFKTNIKENSTREKIENDISGHVIIEENATYAEQAKMINDRERVLKKRAWF